MTNFLAHLLLNPNTDSSLKEFSDFPHDISKSKVATIGTDFHIRLNMVWDNCRRVCHWLDRQNSLMHPPSYPVHEVRGQQQEDSAIADIPHHHLHPSTLPSCSAVHQLCGDIDGPAS